MTRRSQLIFAATIAALGVGIGSAIGQEARSTNDSTSVATHTTAKPWFGVGWDDGIAFRARLGSRWGVGVRVNPDLVDSKTDAHTSYTSHEQGADDSLIVRPPTVGEWSSDGASGTDMSQKDNTRTFGLSAMAFYERDFGRWFAAGPYLALNYQRQTYDTTQHVNDTSSWTYKHPIWPSSNDYESWTDVDSKHWERSIGAELGVRPVLKLHDRFIVETRFGIELASTKWTDKGTQTQRWDSSSSSGGGITPPIPLDIVARQAGTGSMETTIDNSGSSTRFHAIGDHVISDFQIRFIIFL